MLEKNMEKVPPLHIYKIKIYLIEGIGEPIRVVDIN